MSFTSPTLKFKAVTYKSKTSPLKITERSIALERQPDGTYNVGPTKALVKVHSAALNPVDYILKQLASFPFNTFYGDQGIGLDYSGTIAAIGPQAAAKTGLKVGDVVSGVFVHFHHDGTVAEYVQLDSKVLRDLDVTKAPKNLTLEEASSWPAVLGTAFQVVDGLDFKGKKVLVIGAGTSVGKYTVQLAKYGQAKEIVVTASSKSAPASIEYGATSVIDYTKHKSILNPVLESVKESGKFDYILDAAGNGDLFPQIHHIVHAKSSYVSAAGDRKADYTKATFFSFVSGVIGSVFRNVRSKLGLLGYRYEFISYNPPGRWIDKGKKLIEEGHLKVEIDSVFKFDQYQNAVDKVKTSQAKGKVVIQVEGNV